MLSTKRCFVREDEFSLALFTSRSVGPTGTDDYGPLDM